ncbi:SPOR domain-containing protein [Roseomonas sp. OT10]|uniref:SPOR domain-containing protein n=1 Tax=Roseomonas cutis TaxID=2897332 RepID=UPI001E4A4757|nr:SPOR domain-containing protein [Roseomonas sp. OT10]UFN50736.1 SPOR domain-containing protein [Roseomonas sp. OT10]
MSDITVPSYRVHREAGGGIPWRMLGIAGAVLGVMGTGAAVVWGVSRAVSTGVPVIEADNRPIRVKPDDPGGLRVANQDERIFEMQRRNAQQARTGQPPAAAPTQVVPEPERPDLAALRQATQAARQPPPAPRQAAPPAPAAAQPAAGGPPAAAPEPAAARAPAAAPPAARTTGGGRFQVQLGALTSEEGAKAEWDRLQRRLGDLLSDRRPQVLRFERDGLPTMWRLRTGGFADADAAKAFCDAAKAKGAPACATIGG